MLFCTAVAAQESVQKLMERGALQEAVDRAASEGGNPESTYLAAQALAKMDNNGGAEERYSRLREDGNDAWKAIGESGSKLIAGDLDGAMDAANRAVAADGGNPYGHYQLGMVAFKQGNFQRTVQALERSLEIKPDLAYAHYYGGMAAQRLRQTPKMAEHLGQFLKIAPEAPERQAVQSILRALR
jgi:tetratricopeptide (TPR) repeat protein